MMIRKTLFPALLLLLLAACGGPPPEPELDRLYRALADRPEDFDRACLRGKRILIDPGHGGAFSGAVGAGGLAEKDANLGVALYLWGLLREAGAEATLTRSADRDFAGGDGENGLEADLAARVALIDSIRPHLFLSLHHNAAADTNRARNRVETYYREGDEASLDAARRIHASLTRNLGIDEGAVLPGNYAVLRNAGRPAVLGEPSYLSHPPVEDKLALGEKRRLEAEAYFIGIVDYFRRGVPEARIDAPPGRVRLPEDFAFSGEVRDEPGHAGVDPSSVRVLLDGRPLEGRYDPAGGAVRAALPRLLAPGTHRITLNARNREGNAAIPAERVFLVDPPPARAILSGIRAPGERTVHLRVRFEDRRGLPAGEGTRTTIDGGGGAAEGTIRSGTLALSLAPDSLPAEIRFTGEGFSIGETLRESDLDSPPALLLLSDRDGSPAAGADLWIDGEPGGQAGPDGWAGLPRIPAEGERIRVEAPGAPPLLATAGGAPIDTIRIDGPPPPLGGRVVLIDPAGRGEGGDPPSASLLLAAAREMEEMLLFWEARASLTRNGPLPLPERDRIPLARKEGADLWITLDEGPDYEVRHYPGSVRGEPLARAVAAEMERSLGRPVSVRGATDRVLRETPCPALRIILPLERERNGGGSSSFPIGAIGEGIRLRFDPSPEERSVLLFPSLGEGDEIRIDDRAGFRVPPEGSLRVVLPAPGRWMIRIRRSGVWETRALDVPPGGEAVVR